MTKKLNWRLSELPTGSEVAELVEQEIITKEEARDILFKDVEKEDRSLEVKALKEQIRFMEKIIDKLSNNHSWTNVTYTPSYPTKYWLNTSSINCSSGSLTTGSLGDTVSYSNTTT